MCKGHGVERMTVNAEGAPVRSASFWLVGMAVGLCAQPLSAQHSQTREGFWIALGPGYGSSHFSCTGCTGETKGGWTFDLRMGGTLRPNLLLGGDLSVWYHTENSVTETFGTIAFAGYFYPMVQSGLFVKAGVGLSTARFERNGGTAYGSGLGGIFGAGYDIRIAPNTSITPLVQFQYGAVGDVKFPSGSAMFPGLTQTLIAAGVDVTFH